MPRKKTDTNERIEVAGIVTTKKRLKFAKEAVMNGGNKTKALQKAGYSVKHPRQSAHQVIQNPEVVTLMNVIKQQIRAINPLTMDEIKQFGAEASVVSVVDLTEEDGTINLANIKKRGLARFIKELKIVEQFDKDGNKTVTTEVKGYDRLQALRMLSLIQKDEESRDIQIVQAISSLFATHPQLRDEKHRVFEGFAKKFAVPTDQIENLFNRFGQFYLEE